jgi:hypothetical protein
MLLSRGRMRSLLVALVPLALACNTGLDVPSAAHGSTSGGAVACESFTTQTACEAETGCYAVLSAGEPCDSIGCEPHFLSCASGPVDCHVPVTCAVPNFPGYCPIGFTAIVPPGGCLSECVRSSLCGGCSAHTDDASCEADTTCHARFDDVPCAQSPCPPAFTRCEQGPAQCAPGPSPSPDDCPEALETCDTDDNFVPAYFDNNCPDGCVRAQDCPLSNGE